MFCTILFHSSVIFLIRKYSPVLTPFLFFHRWLWPWEVDWHIRHSLMSNIEIYLSYLTKSSSFNKFSPLNNLLCAISSRTRIILSFELGTNPNRDSSFSVCFSMNLIWVGMKQALQENTIYVCQPPFEIAFKFKLKVK